MSTLYLVIHLFGLSIGIPLGDYDREHCGQIADALPLLACVSLEGERQ